VRPATLAVPMLPVRRPLTVLAVLAVLALMSGVAACGGDSSSSTASAPAATTVTTQAPVAAPAQAYPATATKNTTRVATASSVATAAAVARIVFPGGGAGQVPDAVVLADAGDWRGALAGAVLMAPPLRAPLLYTEGGELPDATKAALGALHPAGSARANNAQAIRLGTAAGPGGLRVTSLPGADPYTLAQSIDDYRSRVAGRPSDAVMVVAADRPEYAMPAAAYAAKSGDPVLFTARDTLPAPTRAAIRAHGRPHIYVLGPVSAVSAAVEAQLAQLGTVTRIAAADAPSTAIAFARFQDGNFGWGVVDPGHGFVFVSPRRPGDAGAAAPLSASGTYGPLLLTAPGGSLPRSVTEYLLDVKPGYSSDPVRGVYNHGWIVGDTQTVGVAAQATIDGLLEIAPVPAKQP